MAVATADTLEGTIDEVLGFHFDLRNDVLYLRLSSRLGEDTHGEETEDGDILLRSLRDDSVVGVTLISYWRRFGQGPITEATVAKLAKSIEERADGWPL